MSADGKRILTISDDRTARLWNEKGECLHVFKGYEDWVKDSTLSADGNTVMTTSNGIMRYWQERKGEWGCVLELHPETQTRIWLEGSSGTLKIDGGDWPYWQLHNSDESIRDALGETIAVYGPMAHEKLANADSWRFWPRDDI